MIAVVAVFIVAGCRPKQVVHPATLKIKLDEPLPQSHDDLSSVAFLELHAVQITPDVIDVIDRCENLGVLSIRACNVPQKSTLQISPKIGQLYLSGLRTTHPLSIVGGESLTMAIVNSCELDSFDLDALHSDNTLTQLTVVDCTLSDDTITWIHRQRNLSTLQYGNNDSINDVFTGWASRNFVSVDLAGMVPTTDALAFLERQPYLSHYSIDLCGDSTARSAIALLKRETITSASLFCARKDLARYTKLSSRGVPFVNVYERNGPLTRTKYPSEP